MDKSILAPAAILVLWSLIMMIWMAATRLPAMKKIGIDLSSNVGGRGADIDPNVPPSVAWKSHNYAHLMEQPTIFYAAVFILALAGAVTPLMVSLAWGYTILRVLHSLWQATINKVSIRFVLFLLSSICLVIMAVNAVLATISL
jgi:hypothetical protein